MKKIIRIININYFIYYAYLFSNKIHEITATKLLHRTWSMSNYIAAVSIITKIIIMTHENRTKYIQQKQSEERMREEKGTRASSSKKVGTGCVTIDENLLPTKSDVSATN